MKTFFITFIVTTIALLGCGLLINFCKRKLRKTSHSLTGMCHKNGGEICESCSDREIEPNKSTTLASTKKKG